MEFAVRHEGMSEGTGRWVLHIDGDRVLLSDDQGAFYWMPLSECMLFKVATPEAPRPVVVLQSQQEPQIVMPNRQMRRNGGF